MNHLEVSLVSVAFVSKVSWSEKSSFYLVTMVVSAERHCNLIDVLFR